MARRLLLAKVPRQHHGRMRSHATRHGHRASQSGEGSAASPKLDGRPVRAATAGQPDDVADGTVCRIWVRGDRAVTAIIGASLVGAPGEGDCA